MNVQIQDNDDIQNVYANDITGSPIHISDAKSGRQGYYCMGCNREMQAVKSKMANRISYFRHDPKDVVNKGKCTYSDETYRHKLAKEILVRIKQIKVPAIYKYPPDGYEGKAYLIKQAEIIHAHSVEVERAFYEDDSGKILWGSQNDSNGKNLLIVPDVIFFNEAKEPILFIEIVVKHRVDDEKKIKIRRLGINTIQVKIPKDSPENIERAFSTTERTKWIFNYEQATTDYFRISKGNSEGVSSVDEIQRELFEETFRCRSTQVGNLIRAIGKCLDSKQYRDIEHAFKSEIRRVEDNAKNDSERLQGLQSKYDEEAYCELETERTKIQSKEERILRLFEGLHERYKSKRGCIERELSKEEERILRLYPQIVNRYKRKREDLVREEKQFTTGIESELSRYGLSGSTFTERKRDIERKIGDEEIFIKQEETIIGRLEESAESLPRNFERDQERVRSEFGDLEDEERSAIDDVSEGRETIQERFEKLGEETIRRFEGLRKESTDRIKKRDTSGDTELSRHIKELLYFRGVLLDFLTEEGAFKRNRRAWESFKSGAFKNWDFSK